MESTKSYLDVIINEVVYDVYVGLCLGMKF